MVMVMMKNPSMIRKGALEEHHHLLEVVARAAVEVDIVDVAGHPKVRKMRKSSLQENLDNYVGYVELY